MYLYIFVFFEYLIFIRFLVLRYMKIQIYILKYSKREVKMDIEIKGNENLLNVLFEGMS